MQVYKIGKQKYSNILKRHFKQYIYPISIVYSWILPIFPVSGCVSQFQPRMFLNILYLYTKLHHVHVLMCFWPLFYVKIQFVFVSVSVCQIYPVCLHVSSVTLPSVSTCVYVSDLPCVYIHDTSVCVSRRWSLCPGEEAGQLQWCPAPGLQSPADQLQNCDNISEHIIHKT